MVSHNKAPESVDDIVERLLQLGIDLRTPVAPTRPSSPVATATTATRASKSDTNLICILILTPHYLLDDDGQGDSQAAGSPAAATEGDSQAAGSPAAATGLRRQGK
jgi:hypothetical protein